MTETFNIPYESASIYEPNYNTLVDEIYSANEQRRALEDADTKRWTLTFKKNNEVSQQILAFFDACQGRLKAFNWVWSDSEQIGGDGVTYLVRFDTDKLDFSMAHFGWSEVQVPFIQVHDND